MKLLRVCIRGWTATFRLPLLYTGTGLSAPVPPYSTLLGLIGSGAGREMQPTETRIGYEFRSEGLALDLERTQRLMMRARQLRPHPERGVARRQFHVRPQLDLYLDNLELRPVFESPQNVLCLGRSQDVAWITSVDVVEAQPVASGEVWGTLVPFPEPNAGGVILRLPDYFTNADLGRTRRLGRLELYQAITYATPAHVQREGLVRLETWQDNHAIYLHTLATP